MAENKLQILNFKCACGAVAGRLHAPFREPIACHCESCRRQTGHFVVATAVADENLELFKEQNLKWWDATEQAKRGFCGDCGSLLFWKAHNSDQTSVLMGCIDPPTGLRLEKHIFKDEKSDYYDV